jgi:DNA-binding NarL/FixJ family response regulator
MRIALADDHRVVLDGLRAVLAAQADFEIVGDAVDAPGVLSLVERTKPDVLVLDLMMPGANGIEIARELAKSAPAVRIVILSMHANEGYVAEALRSGATAYVLKNCPTEELVQAIRMAARGQRHVSGVLEHEIERYLSQMKSAVDPMDTLTAREREVLQLVGEGKKNREVAKLLGIGSRTVESHRENMMRKLGLRSTADVVLFAVRRGMVKSG